MSAWNQWEWAQPEAFWLLLLLPLWLLLYRHRRGREQATVLFSHQPLAWRRSAMTHGWGIHAANGLLALALVPLIGALARPQLSQSKQQVSTEGIDVVLALDISSSMLALDFEPNRLAAAKNQAEAFIQSRPNDRVGLVVFAGESFTQCPLTSDHQIVREQLQSVRVGVLEDGTAIGLGLATAVDRLKESVAESKVVVLLTDGENNAGFIDPKTASEIAEEYGIRVYTIGVGSTGTAPYPTNRRYPGSKRYRYRQMEVEIDEELLQHIARKTNGRYFRATDAEALQKIYEEIDQLEKTRIEVSTSTRYQEAHRSLLQVFAIMVSLALSLKYLVFRTLT